MAGRNSILRRKYTRNEIVSDLETYLREQELPADTLIASASRLAQRYNVSVATINRALDSLVERKVLYRVQGSGTFTARPSTIWKRLRLGIILQARGDDKSDLYGKVAFGNLNTMFQQNCQKGGHDCSFYFHPCPFPIEQLEHLRLYEFDALIVTEGHATPENSELFKKLGIPIITCLGDSISRTDFHQVIFDFKPGFCKLLVHLRDMGYQSFLIASNESGRTEAVLRAADELGISREAFEHKSCRRRYRAEYWHTVGSAYEIAEYYLEKCLSASAIISTSDYISRGIIDYLSEKGLEPGRDYAIGSYDNFEKHGIMIHGSRPVLTSITHPMEKMAVEAGKLAVSEALAPSGVRHVVEVPAHELMIRASTRLKINTKRGVK